ncbi:MAG: carboxypeptidase-like regulatory domain-containing protein [Candidatus Krumholzibacteriia bacterium]
MQGRLRALAAVVGLLTGLSLAATAGDLVGTVLDQDTGEELIAVDVVLIGTGLFTQTDLDGRFFFTDLAAGAYNLRISYLGYNTKVLADVAVPADGEKQITVKIESFRADAIDDVMVTATRVLSTESAVLADRKNAAVVGDAISAAQISRSPDSQAGDAMKRVTGVTVRGGQYVNVRGMPDRYNVTIVDGAVVTSVDPDLDRKSFNFEMIPASLLASLKVVKTPTPDLPGDFTGGLVEIRTIEFPDKPTTSVSMGTGWNSGVTGKDFYRDAYSGSLDALGWDDGGRDLPEAVADAGPRPTEATAYPDAVGRALDNRWGTEKTAAPLPSSLSISHGDRYTLFGRDVGLVAAVTHSAGSDVTETYKSYDPTSEYFASTNYVGDVRVGALCNVNLKVSERQILSFKNLLGHTAEESYLTAYKLLNALTYWHVLEWEEKNQLTSSLGGSHALPLARDLVWDWQVFYNENRAKEPDRRWLEYNMETDPVRLFTNRRHWLRADEYRRGLETSLTWTVGDADRPTRLKAGLVLSTRRRAVANAPYTALADGTAAGLVFLPPDQIFAPSNFKEGLFTLRYQDQFEGSYEGSHVSNAYYAMVDVPFELFQEEFRLAGGARLENNQLAVEAYDKGIDATIPASAVSTDVLPSLNLTYQYDEKTNVRLAYFNSVNYPDMREVAGVTSVDLVNDYAVLGNPGLRRAKVKNYDSRLEYFPAYGEVLAVSAFYKEFTDAIEAKFTESSSYWDQLSWFNGDGKNYGFELEFRKRLEVLGGGFSELTLMGNYSRIWSEVAYRRLQNPDSPNESVRSVPATRQLQGQSPWVVNVSLQWEEVDWGTTIAVLFNKIGRRVNSLSEQTEENIYEEPRNQLDAAVTQAIPGDGKLKFTVKNILGEDTRWSHDVDRSAGYRDPRTLAYGHASDSASYKLSLSWKF